MRNSRNMKRSRSLLLFMLCVTTLMARADRAWLYYKNVQVDAVVFLANVWGGTEIIDVLFDEPHYGIYRYIPVSFSLQYS